MGTTKAMSLCVKNFKPQHTSWVTEHSDGGRGFGFTGGHFHKNWANENFRKLVLNAIVWTAKINVPQMALLFLNFLIPTWLLTLIPSLAQDIFKN